MAPDFSLEDAAGKRVSLGDYRGRYVVVYFYPRDDTPGCTKEACGFRDLDAEIRERGAVVLGISPDDGAAPPEVRGEVRPALHPALRPGTRGHGALRRLGREDDVREEDGGSHPLDGHRRAGRGGREALAAGREGGGPSPEGARSARSASCRLRRGPRAVAPRCRGPGRLARAIGARAAAVGGAPGKTALPGRRRCRGYLEGRSRGARESLPARVSAGHRRSPGCRPRSREGMKR